MIPMIKEYRIEKIILCLECIDKNTFDRDKQKECILSLYPGKSEKSVFRGMVISTLRHMELILGYSDTIKVSANAKLIIKSKDNVTLHNRVLRAIFVELDLKIFKFIHLIQAKGEFVYNSDSKIRERAKKWISILNQLEIIEEGAVNSKIFEKSLADLNINSKKAEFKNILFEEYKKLVSNVNMVDIVDLREKVALCFLLKNKILTEDQFDTLLKNIKPITKDYIISFGSSIGTGKPFKYENNYYGTISIKEMVG